MLDASVALLTKAGVPIKQLLDYLEEMLHEKSLLSNGAFFMKHVQREDGINPTIHYTLSVASGVLVSGETSPTLRVQVATPPKGIFTGDVEDLANWVLGYSTTGIVVNDIDHNTATDIVSLNYSGEVSNGSVSIQAKAAILLNDQRSETLLVAVTV